jgi:hypothetical protein
MKKLRLFLVGALVAGFLVVAAGPASADCAGDPDVCAVVCQIGLGNKYTHHLFEFCYVL